MMADDMFTDFCKLLDSPERIEGFLEQLRARQELLSDELRRLDAVTAMLTSSLPAYDERRHGPRISVRVAVTKVLQERGVVMRSRELIEPVEQLRGIPMNPTRRLNAVCARLAI